ncbi:MAG: hypothetical protein RDU30_03190 [Desulfovibrionaceae bacterium]|nr:hypothetical protein [Desulfovibrionaceae bacterium]
MEDRRDKPRQNPEARLYGLVRKAVRQEMGTTCACGLDREACREMGALADLVHEAGIESIREDHRFVAEMRAGVRHVKMTAVSAVVCGVLTVLGAGIFLWLKSMGGK